MYKIISDSACDLSKEYVEKNQRYASVLYRNAYCILEICTGQYSH